ncbi:phosphohydrolase [Vibrio sp. MACH09]|uniref:HD domain-containing protein n=1 Tax=Vibrio sp. MACH09 TaxID=3025122 RepID=UPI00278D724D|nr:HD domain-containing protein [Vibrio sp. MACH09]GLO63466.1 phosphohydrolase [Vibrio sp. MACH09]
MNFDRNLLGKILDPIHGTIMITDIERQVIGHRLFQRLRNVKQNTFLYKVFPSAMHSRFEHSLGVMHVAYEMLNNLQLNSYRYDVKYCDEILFRYLDQLSLVNIQELRIAALLHDIGHGPMSHQFDSFLMSKSQLEGVLGNEYSDVYDLIHAENDVEHEHISLIFIRKIIKDLSLGEYVDTDNILKLIENKYKGGEVLVEINGSKFDIQPLFTSLISSCPIDADRMDYLLRDSYFSGVKCGIYNIERLLKSIVPVLDGNQICLAYKESCLDSISEFVFSRSNLFSQVYFHKTNRAFSSMLGKVCEIALSKGTEHILSEMYQLEEGMGHHNLEQLQEFYLDNSDDEFINVTVPKLIEGSPVAENLINDVVDRKPWKKLYESRLYISDQGISSKVDKTMISDIRQSLSLELEKVISRDEFIIDIMSDNTFKDIDKTKIKLLVKSPDGSYESKKISECDEKLDMYQSIRYFIRVFIKPTVLEMIDEKLTENLENIKADVCEMY